MGLTNQMKYMIYGYLNPFPSKYYLGLVVVHLIVLP